MTPLAGSGFVRRLPRQPGRKESRYIHLLCGEPEIAEVKYIETALTSAHGVAVESERIEKVEQDLQTLRNDLAELIREFQEFKNRFN